MKEQDSSQKTSSPLKFYRGVVVDNNDPQKIGRVRVKIFGLNDNEANDDLPWADVLQSATFGLIGGVGFSNVLKQGTWVIVIFEEGNSNKQLVLGVTTGISEIRNDGFSDPLNEFPQTGTFGKSDFAHCCVDDFSLNNKGLTDSTITSHGTMFNYNNSVTDTKYTQMSVLKTSSGIMIELDDSDERLKITHPSGTTIEIQSDGSIQTVCTNKVKMNVKSDVEWNILGNWKMNIDGNISWDVMGDFNVYVDKSLNYYINKDYNYYINENFYTFVKSTSKFNSDTYTINVCNDFNGSASKLNFNFGNGLMKGANVITDRNVNLNRHKHICDKDWTTNKVE